MTTVPSEHTRCRCGRSTYSVSGTEHLRTCSQCGYLTSYCKCKREGAGGIRASLDLSSLSDRTRAMVGAGVLSSLGTLFVLTLISSPFMAIFGLGIPFGISASFFVQWLKDEGSQVPETSMSVAVPSEARGRPLRQ